MSRFSQLIKHVERLNSQLASDLEQAFNEANGPRRVGLYFEPHAPEIVQISSRPVRKGDKVKFIPERGTAVDVDTRTWRVATINKAGGTPTAHLIEHVPEGDVGQTEPDTEIRAIEDLVVVAEFRDPIYPGLVSTGKIERGNDKPFHTLINSENFHALQTLLYTHEGKIDAIYIDPPYNSGARDWKYNNDYVDGEDIYRHSKWLAFMERRLELSKRLLNPDGSVLIVTIDEKEYLRLGLLLEQTFQDATIQMVSSQINPKGTGRSNEFNRVDEYLFFVWQGDATLGRLPADVEGATAAEVEQKLPWDTMRRRNLASVRGRTGPGACGPNQFYAIHIDQTTGRIVGRGDPIPTSMMITDYVPPAGTIAVFPVRDDGTEMNWSLTDIAFDQRWSNGYVRAGKPTPDRPQPYLIQYLTSSTIKALEGNAEALAERAPDGSVKGTIRVSTARIPRTQWSMQSHNSEHYGTSLVKALLGGRSFPFPKSLYAVEDSLRLFLAGKPDAIVLDFFAGSGTTAHAVMRLNKQDGGRRRSISITNNEVAVDEQVRLRTEGLRPGDPGWERLGICDYITKPRISAAITGSTPAGNPVKGEYRFTDVFPMADGFEENVEFFTLTYETPRMIAHNRSFEAIAPLLWLRAGAEGTRICDVPAAGFAVVDTYGVLFELDRSRAFIDAFRAQQTARMAFIVTNDDREFQLVCSELPSHAEPVRLYESYLTNFTINSGSAS